jgi:hypothetical protein
VRKDHPYLVYDRFDFDVPVGSKGDNFDRYESFEREQAGKSNNKGDSSSAAAIAALIPRGARSKARCQATWK